MVRRAIGSGSMAEEQGGYARAVIDGDWIFVSGTVGIDPHTAVLPEAAEEQARLALRRIADTLAEVGASLRDIVSLRVQIAAREHGAPVARVLAATFSDPKPAATTIVCGFLDEAVKIQLEVVARRAEVQPR